MKLSHVAVLIFVAAIWGFNFVPIKLGLNHVPPITFSAMRFFFVAFPALFFVKRPALSLQQIAVFGLFMFVGQFAFLFSAMHAGLSTGLASLVLQVQAFFSIGFAVLFLGEKPKSYQLIGAAVAACGIVFVGYHVGGDVSLLGLLLAVCAAASWGGGNVLTKKFGKVDIFGLVVWGSVFSFPALAVLAFMIEGTDAVVKSVIEIVPMTLIALVYIVYISTFVGFTLWGRMLSQYPAALVAPFTLLVPAFGMLSASLVLSEPYPLWKLSATLFILSGLAINQFGGKLVNFVRCRFVVAK